MFYLLNLIAVPIYYLLCMALFCKHKANNVFITIACIHAILFRCFANPLNYVDTEGYAKAFAYLGEISLQESLTSVYSSWGIGFVILNWILSKFSTNYMVLFTFLSVVSVGGVFWFYKKTSYAFLITVLFYLSYPMLYYMGFGVVRHHFSIVFMLLALFFVDKFRVSVLFALLGFSFHTSCIIFFPFYLWRIIKFERIKAFYTVLIAILGFFIMRLSMSYVLSYLPRYMDQGFGEKGNSNILPIFLIGSVLLLMYFSGTFRKLVTKREKNNFSFMTYGFMISLFSFGLQGAGRLTLVFIYLLPVLISYLKRYSTPKILFYNMYVCIIGLLVCILIYISYTPVSYDYISVYENVRVYK